MASLTGARTQQVVPPPLGAAADYGLLSRAAYQQVSATSRQVGANTASGLDYGIAATPGSQQPGRRAKR